jgi:hypothetical protein
LGMPPQMPGGQPGGALPAILSALAQKQQPNAGAQFAQGAGAAQGADPTMLARQADQIKQVMGVMFVRTMMEQPAVANEISNAMKAWSKVIEKLQQNSQVTQAVGQQPSSPPIGLSPAMGGIQNAPGSPTAAPDAG